LSFGEPVGWRRWLAIAARLYRRSRYRSAGVEGFNQFSLFALISSSSSLYAIRDQANTRADSIGCSSPW